MEPNMSVQAIPPGFRTSSLCDASKDPTRSLAAAVALRLDPSGLRYDAVGLDSAGTLGLNFALINRSVQVQTLVPTACPYTLPLCILPCILPLFTLPQLHQIPH